MALSLPRIDVPWGEIGYVVYKRTYSRRIDGGGSEEFDDTVKRVLTACQQQLGVGFTDDELLRAWGYLMGLKCTVAGRFMWSLGTATVDRLGLMSLQNCMYVSVDSLSAFPIILDALMLGTGVGFGVQRKHVSQLPMLLDVDVSIQRHDTKDADFIIPDSREGWGRLVEAVVRAYFETGESMSYSAILIRSKGAPIKAFGGVASGPEDLCMGISNICGILRRRRGKHLSPVDCMDVINIIAQIVVSGNVRRSALIAIGDPDDIEFLRAKRWDLGNVPNWRCFSNNSVDFSGDIDDLPPEFWEGYSGNGEPYGLVNLDLCRRVGRLVDGDTYPDPTVQGFNPCISGKSMVHTSTGLRRAIDLVGIPFFAVINGALYPSTDTGFWSSGVRAVHRVTLVNGLTTTTTADHRLLTRGRGWVEVQDLGTDDELVIGDNRSLSPHGISPFDFDRGLMRGLFDKNGAVEGDTVCLRLTDIGNLRAAQLILLTMGVSSSLCDTYLSIKGGDLATFAGVVGFGDPGRQGKLRQIPARFSLTMFGSAVASVVAVGEEEVFDCTIPGTHRFTANGIITSNCGEQPLASHETCCLAEVFLPKVASLEEFKDIAGILYRICKHSLLLPCHQKRTEGMVHDNMRMGIGISGFLMANEEQKAWLSEVYEHLRALDDHYSAKLGCPRSVKLTTVKPGGTVSLLPGVTPGCHPAIFRHFIRRMRIASNNPLVETCRANGYHVEHVQNFDGTKDMGTLVVEFPCRYPDSAVLAENMTAVDELEVVRHLQTVWSDNAISATCYFRPHELEDIKDWLRANYRECVKSISFLLHTNHNFQQPPYSPITKSEYEALKRRVTPIVGCESLLEEDFTLECRGGMCPVK